MVAIAEIEKNEFNLNLPRYIDSQEAEDIQDIDGHLRGGVPLRDVDALASYWKVCPKLRHGLFKDKREGYLDLAVEKSAIKSTIYEHPEFAGFIASMNAHFAAWRDNAAASLRQLQEGCHPKKIVADLSEDLLAHYTGQPLIDKYAVYQHLLDYWAEAMQDDCYLIAADGWKAETYRVIETKEQERQGEGEGLGLRSRSQGAVGRAFLRQGAGGDRWSRGGAWRASTRNLPSWRRSMAARMAPSPNSTR